MPNHLDAPTSNDLDAIAAAYKLGAIREVRFLPDGLMNRNWFLDCDRGRFALKHLTDRDPAAVARNLGLLDGLAAAGVPVAPPLATAEGELVFTAAGNTYYLCEWIEGTHPGADISPTQARHMGEVIARIHTALADPALGLPAPQRIPTAALDPEAALAETGRFLALAANSPAQNEFDRAVVPLLHDRRALIGTHARLRPGPGHSTGPEGWTHGDCQDFNLIWSGDRVKAVIDWDRIRVGSYALELVRAAAWQFRTPDARIDLDKVAAFLTGYRTIRPIDPPPSPAPPATAGGRCSPTAGISTSTTTAPARPATTSSSRITASSHGGPRTSKRSRRPSASACVPLRLEDGSRGRDVGGGR